MIFYSRNLRLRGTKSLLQDNLLIIGRARRVIWKMDVASQVSAYHQAMLLLTEALGHKPALC